MCSGLVELCRTGWYSIYVLLLLVIVYLFNQLDRYMLAIVTKPMAQEIHYGDQVCMLNASFSDEKFPVSYCNATSQDSCLSTVRVNGSEVCEWNYNGQGFEYQVLAGPIFIVIYTLAGIFLGIAADLYNRKILLAVCVVFWSVMTILTGAVHTYWQLVILRLGLGIGEAGCTPFAVSLIGDYFLEGTRATALGVYNWGIYIGYSMSYAAGNYITMANILGQGWRWAFYISGIPGVLVGLLILVSVREPARSSEPGQKDVAGREVVQGDEMTRGQKLKMAMKFFINPSLLLLCLAGSIRNGAGYVWAYNTQPYYESVGQSAEEIGAYMGWIPIVGGVISGIVGGLISDRVVVRSGPNARIVVIIVSLVLAAPFAAGALFLNPPLAYFSLIPTYIIGEMWIGITLAVILEMVPTVVRTTTVAVYLFISSNIGGNMPLLVPVLTQAFVNLGLTPVASLRGALYVLYPGSYLAGAFLYLITLLVLKRDIHRIRRADYTLLAGEDHAEPQAIPENDD